MQCQRKKGLVGLIMCAIVFCVASGCGTAKMESPPIKAESLLEIESNRMDVEPSQAEPMDPSEELVPQELWNTLDGWYVCSTGTPAIKYWPIKDTLIGLIKKTPGTITYSDLWSCDKGDVGGLLVIAYDKTQSSPIAFPALLKELKEIDTLGITTMRNESDPELNNFNNTDKEVPSETKMLQQVEINWSNLESMTWLLSLGIGSDEMGEAKEELFECVKKLKNLESLSIQDSTLTIAPDVFEPLTQLEKLSLLETKIQNYPLSFYQLDSLKTLEVSDGNNSPFDAAQLNGWPLLSRLQLDCTLPEGDYNFPNLEELWFAPDDEGNLPEVVSTFEKLKSLSIYGDFKAVPESYKNLINLEKIYLYSYSEQKPYTDLKNSLIESIQKERARRGLPPSELERPIRPE